MILVGVGLIAAAIGFYAIFLRDNARSPEWDKAGPRLHAFMVVCVLLLIGMGTFFIEQKLDTKETQRIENVARIFMHRPGWWTLMVIQADGSMQTKSISAGDATYIPDVPASGQMWIELRGGDELEGYAFAEFHIRSEKDVEGGEWRSGKTARGQTQVIQ